MERWQAASHDGAAKKMFQSYAELFGNPVYRKRALVGMLIASAGVIGLWGIGFFAVDLNRSVFRKNFEAEARAAQQPEADRDFVRLVLRDPDALPSLKPEVKPADLLSLTPGDKDPIHLLDAIVELQQAKRSISADAVLGLLDEPNEAKQRKAQTAEDRTRRKEYLSGEPTGAAGLEDHAKRIAARVKDIGRRVTRWVSITSLMINIGAFFGIYGFGLLTHRLGRRKTFAIAFLAAGISTALVFWNINRISDVLWMIPIMGFCQLSVFGGYAIYFPELFPTRLRSTGTSFCYNVGRFVAAAGPFTLGYLASGVFGSYPEPYRPAGAVMCLIFLVGIAALPFTPETKGQPLPE